MTLPSRIIILLFFISTASFGQLKSSIRFSLKTGLCETKYFIDSAGIYFTAVSCSKSSTVSFGRYTLSANKIFFKPQSFDSLPPFVRIDESPATNDTITKITFLARYNKIIPDKTFVVDAIDSTGKYFKRFSPDAEGAIFINPHRYKSLRLNYLDHFYAKWVYVQTKPSNLTLELSLPQEFFTHHHPKIDINPGYALTLKPDGLYSADGQRVAFIDK